MSQLPPPPPPSPDDSHERIIPPSAESSGVIDMPPPVSESEQYQADLLKRKKIFSWKKFGGEGFLVSVAFHLLLVIAGIFWIVSRWVEPPKKEDVTFGSGSGGGSGGEKPKSFEHKLQQRTPPMIVKTPSRIVSKSATASIALPSTPATNTASFSSGLTGGGLSKGSGGGSGGGEGTGIGIGKGGGRNFVSLFGSRGLNAVGLPGYFYDFKQTPKKEPTKYASDSASDEYVDQVLRPLVRGFNNSEIDGKFYRSGDQLYASQIFIPSGSADAAPRAFEVEKDVSAKRWAAWYRGRVKAPKSGKFRFWGLGDDALFVRWDSRPALDAGWAILSQGRGHNNHASFAGKPVLGVTATKQGKPSPPFRAGPWFDVTAGRNYPIEIVISEIPGGAFGAWLLMEEADSSGKGSGELFLFRMSGEPLPPGIRNDTGLEVDMTGKNLIWTASGTGTRIR